MTAASSSPLPPALRGEPPAGLSLAGVLRSEWIKIRSVRSTTWSSLAASALLVALGALSAAFTGGLLAAPEGPAPTDPTGVALYGVSLVVLVIAVQGVLGITGEYATGSIRTTLTFVPRPTAVLGAKAAVLAVATLPVMAVATLVTFVVGQAVLAAGEPGTATASLADDGVLRAVLGTAVYLTGIALLGLASGALLRSTPGSISALFALVFLVPGFGTVLLPAGVRGDVLPYLPSNAGAAFTSVTASPDLLGVGAGAAVFAAWVVVPLLFAAVRLERRPM
jgi:ABC-type transport system involved in multi-copper enzyme maturation permease subunit